MAKWSNSEISVTVDEEEIKVKWMVYRNTFFRIILISEAETFLSRLADMFFVHCSWGCFASFNIKRQTNSSEELYDWDQSGSHFSAKWIWIKS